MFPECVETDRLTLAQFCREHVEPDALYELFGESEDSKSTVFEYIPQSPFRTINGADEMLKRAESRWDAGEMAMYAVYSPDPDPDPELAGYTSLSLKWEQRSGTIGIVLAEPFWGREYARECADALTELAFDRLDLEQVSIGHEAGNERSKRAIEKYIERHGGQYEGVLRNRTPVEGRVLDHHRYSVQR